MKFKINSIEMHSERSNFVNVSFVDTNTELDNFNISLYVPIFIKLKENTVCNIPKFVCDNIWSNGSFNSGLPKIKKQCYEKFKDKSLADDYFNKILIDFINLKKLNVVSDEEKIIIGNFIAEPDNKILIDLNVVERTKSKYINSFFGRTYYEMWKLTDDDNNIFIISSGSERTLDIINSSKRIRVMCTLRSQNIFRQEKQNIISVSSYRHIKTLIEKDPEYEHISDEQSN